MNGLVGGPLLVENLGAPAPLNPVQTPGTDGKELNTFRDTRTIRRLTPGCRSLRSLHARRLHVGLHCETIVSSFRVNVSERNENYTVSQKNKTLSSGP